MQAQEIAGLAVSVAALTLSIGTAVTAWSWRRNDLRKAHVSAHFHRNSTYARVGLPSGAARAGYNFVLVNHGPAAATGITFEVSAPGGPGLRLSDLKADELPIRILSPGASYPVPWLLDDPVAQNERLFYCRLSWTDGRGRNEVELQLRRGQTI